MSGLAALTAGRQTGVPVCLTYHALGVVKRRHQGAQDTSPKERIAYERALGRGVDRVIAQCQDEVQELLRMGVPRVADLGDPVRRQRAHVPAGRPGRAARAGAADPVGRPDGRAQGLPGRHRRAAHGSAGRARHPRRPGRAAARAAALLRERLRCRRPGALRRRGAAGGDAALVPLGRRARRGAVVRAVRAHSAGGDGVRRAGGRDRGRRAHRHRRRRRHRRARAAARSAGPGRRAARAARTTGCAGWRTGRRRSTGPGPRTRGSGRPNSSPRSTTAVGGLRRPSGAVA